jgi:hypothetical protein
MAILNRLFCHLLKNSHYLSQNSLLLSILSLKNCPCVNLCGKWYGVSWTNDVLPNNILPNDVLPNYVLPDDILPNSLTAHHRP